MLIKMYALRLFYNKGDAMNLQAKLLMNSLYGKFGMNTDISRVDLYSLSNTQERGNLKKL